ncbi:sensor histidine kinase [Clostridium cellulovorans]|uniref:ATP-binding region ATPase domain protein n=1 Tax=Clostridium cellulovorans (strain ATCC 35296 / DSM 3052 / OCM 3 / 743B) TaxID=573061 RepID=D9SNC2_CLOC7|nr:GHKL domain-containing protein [Clostridium cellulovorans]ADL53914.1 ATP-binding region ATPase domain protein [Clostridium cellulovorans 743B]
MEKLLMQLGSIILFYTAMINLNSFKIKFKEGVLLILITEVFATALLNINEFIAIIPIFAVGAIYIYWNSKSFVRSVSIPLISLIIMILSNNIVGIIAFKVFGFDISMVRNNSMLYWFLIFIGLVLIFIITKVLGVFINRKLNISNLELRGSFAILIIVSLVLAIVIFYANLVLESKLDSGLERGIMNAILFMAYFVLLIIIMYILIININKEMDFKSKQIQFKSLQEYTDKIEKLYTDMRSFRHDYVNILSSMIGYIEEKDIDGLEKYFNEKILPLGKGMESKNFRIDLLKNVKIVEIKGIFSSKLIRAQEIGIDVFIDIVEPIEEINMDVIDLSRVIGIVLDNAIEASEKCDKPLVKVALINKKSSVIIVIINNFVEEVPIYKMYQKGFSTKGENRGLGLYNLKEITDKYKNVHMETIVENGEFKQVFEITNK